MNLRELCKLRHHMPSDEHILWHWIVKKLSWPNFAGMIYPANFEEKIGFGQIRDLLRERCLSEMGMEYVDRMRFSSSRDLIGKLLKQTGEFRNILQQSSAFPSSDYFDLRDELMRLDTPGTYIQQELLFDLKASLITIADIFSFFNNSPERAFPELKKLTWHLVLPEEIIPSAARIIDDKGEIRDSASDKLSDIRKAIQAKVKQATAEIKKAFNLAKQSGWAIANAEITIRNGRSVIPLHAADKRALGGIIQDESASGQTVFVEPAKAFEINNQIRELQSEERREIIRILTRFTDNIRPHVEDLIALYRFLGLIDFIRAKALLAIKIGADQPDLADDRTLSLQQAIHPLLSIAHQASGKPVIPLDLDLSQDQRILVISGPNAGGKSVCLKTVGLLQYMLQCGLQIPASPDSILPVFKRLFIDIGDEQSLENDLSTYSSHLINMKFFLEHANSDTLFLIDEFGTGTEPQLGGSIAEAALEQLNQKKSFGVITTHYSNLKVAAQKTPGMLNGAMLFDSAEMKPLYKLQIGNPGSSFAYEIARSIGFPEQVLNRARKKSGGKHVSFDEQLQQLEVEKIELEKKEQMLQSKDEKLSSMIEKYSNLLEDIRRNKKGLIEKARQEAYEIVADSNKLVENTIRDIRKVHAEKEKTKTIRKKLQEEKARIKADATAASSPKSGPENEELEDEDLSGPVRPGDAVRVKGTDIIGELIEVDGSDAFVDVNEVKLRTTLSKLVKSKKKPVTRKSGHAVRSSKNLVTDIHERAALFNLSIDLRGKKVDEAIALVTRYIDEATMLGIKEVSILHGKGDGILRPAIREYLQKVSEVRQFRDAPLEHGGAGITKVYFH